MTILREPRNGKERTGGGRWDPRLLVVDDDNSHRETLARHLRSQGFRVEAADSAESAVPLLNAFGPEIVLTDIRMGGMSGFELLKLIKDSAFDADVIMITAFEHTQGVIDAMQMGAYDYLVKPLDLDRLDSVVDRCLVDRAARTGGGASAKVESVSDASPILVGRDPRMLEVFKLIGMVSKSRATVVVRGETGTGKELVARTIHANSEHPDEPFVAVNCAALPPSLLESELFGHVKGAFTGAASDRKGRFELAGRGTIFLDEIGDTSPDLQAKLLRVLQERTFMCVGGEELRTTEARVIAATHRPLESLVEAGEFREDLFFRLRVIEISVPPLRERKCDIPLLVQHLLERANRELGRAATTVPAEVMAEIVAHPWPGNVRELENALTRAVVMAKGPAISSAGLHLNGDVPPELAHIDGSSLNEMEAAHIQRTLMRAAGNKSATARQLGISRPRLDRMIERHGLVV
jgi:DNA-binding NtrC family response regulator